MRKILEALGNAFRGLFGGLGFLGRWLEATAGAAADGIGWCAHAAVALPVAAVGGVANLLFGGNQPEQGGPSAGERQAATQQQADAADDAKIRIHSVRRIASSRSKGAPIEAEAAEQLDRKVLKYLAALSIEECAVLAVARTGKLRALLEKGEAPEGVRSPQQVADGFQIRICPPAGGEPQADHANQVAVPQPTAAPTIVAAVGAWRQRRGYGYGDAGEPTHGLMPA
jgi:hypothetical protein